MCSGLTAYFNVKRQNTKRRRLFSEYRYTFENGEEIIKRYAVGRIAQALLYMYQVKGSGIS